MKRHHHSELLGLSDDKLMELAPEATHQHYKGGLYRLIGPFCDASDGLQVIGSDGFARVLYKHCYPHAEGFWVRDNTDFYGTVTLPKVEPLGSDIQVPRFRQLDA